MLYFAPWKIATIILVSFLSLLFTMPNFLPKSVVEQFPSWAPQKRMPLGLDLQGGSHLLLQMNTQELLANWLNTIESDVRRELRGDPSGARPVERIPYTGLGVASDAVRVTLRNPADMDKAMTRLKRIPQPLSNSLFGGTSGNDIEIITPGGGVIELRPTQQALTERTTGALDASIETIRRRVDALGTTEPVIQRQGRDRILVQVPGFNDPQTLKELISKTARLTFQLVDPISAEEAERRGLPEGTAFYPSAEDPNRREVLRTEVIVGGENLVDAQPGFDQRTGGPIVSFRFDAQGAQRFAQVTARNVGKPFAIVLDGKVISAPTIEEPILGGSGQISGRGFTVEGVNELSIQLRSGALPASLQIVEERTVGPSLGADSIEAGKVAAIIGFTGVAAFLIIGYGLFGLFSVMALVINLALITATMSLLGATLTLPGIAGIVLTMGMSVDANVLINERIREELRSGKSAITAIDIAFTKAIGTITDTNLTGLLVAFIMFWLGSGPVRGFAVTLGVGILASFFTATTITRYLVAQWVRWNRPTTVPI
ncbi:MAG: protein translocase subunit SecD [Hyphomicrobiales bacterium]|nr:protein translocase subunit SecD [Hyphomicrobiales bacterium]